MKNSAAAALLAAERAFQKNSSLPLSDAFPTDPENEGKQRLKGAFLIELTRIIRDESQPRREFDPEQMRHLIDSVRERGVRQPIRVWWNVAMDCYQIISGERRFRAAEAAGIPAIPCIIEEIPANARMLDRKSILIDQIVENWQRADLNPYELSDALAKLQGELGMRQEEIAKLIGKPKSEISRFLAMQKVEPAVQEQIRRDESHAFSRRHVVALSQLPPDEQRRLVEKIKMESLSAVETERSVARLKSKGHGVPARGTRVTVRKYAVGAATVQITFRKAMVSHAEVLHVLERVRAMVEQEQSTALRE